MSRAAVSPATVAVVENDLVIDTFAFSGESIRLTAAMSWGAIRAKATGMSGLDTMTINLKGKVTSQMSAEGTCVSFRNGKEAYRGKWVLTPLPAGGR